MKRFSPMKLRGALPGCRSYHRDRLTENRATVLTASASCGKTGGNSQFSQRRRDGVTEKK
jgi:hypothetical protein